MIHIYSWYVPFHHLVQERQSLLASPLFYGGKVEIIEHVCNLSLMSGLVVTCDDLGC